MMKIKFSVWLLLVLSLSSCTYDKHEINSYISKVKARPGSDIAPIPKFKKLPKFEFPDKISRRSPFRPVVKKIFDEAAPNMNRKKDPLESYPLDALKFVGAIRARSINWGLVQLPNKKVVRIVRGEYIGKNFGRVLAIRMDVVKLEESVKVNGKWKKNIINIKIATPK